MLIIFQPDVINAHNCTEKVTFNKLVFLKKEKQKAHCNYIYHFSGIYKVSLKAAPIKKLKTTVYTGRGESIQISCIVYKELSKHLNREGIFFFSFSKG